MNQNEINNQTIIIVLMTMTVHAVALNKSLYLFYHFMSIQHIFSHIYLINAEKMIKM